MTVRRLLVTGLLACLLGACGQKGPLTLPDAPRTEVPATDQASDPARKNTERSATP
jgi:predicted small lipoprotein YifL